MLTLDPDDDIDPFAEFSLTITVPFTARLEDLGAGDPYEDALMLRNLLYGDPTVFGENVLKAIDTDEYTLAVAPA